MNIIETTAPIKIEELKKYFLDKNTFYQIDYNNSQIQGKKLLTYLSNLDVPCDITVDMYSQEGKELLKEYLNFPLLTNIPSLEEKTIQLLLQCKGVADYGFSEFIKDNHETLDKWIQILDSLLYFNTYCINDDKYKSQIENSKSFEEDFIIGVNFVSLLKHESFYDFYINVNPKNFKYHRSYFNDYLFKGKNLFAFWANANNPIYIITWAVELGNINPDDFVSAFQKDIEEIQSVSFV